MYDFGVDIERYLKALSDVLRRLDRGQINSVMNAITEAYEKEARVFIFGNGGSAAIASHFTCDFNRCIPRGSKKGFEFVCLNDNIPTMLAIANDHGYENMFLFQLEGRMRKDDIVIAISGSGNSKNVIKAAEYAKANGNKVIALAGYDGGELIGLADLCIHADINDMQKAEDVYIIMDHLMSQIISRKLGGGPC